jgi:hypothetical protein
MPLEVLNARQELESVNSSILELYNFIENELVVAFGGATIYKTNGKYFNSALHRVFDIKTNVLEIYTTEENKDYLISRINDFAYRIKSDLLQESVVYSVNNVMVSV